MATNLVYRNTDSRNRVETLAATHAPGAAVLSGDSSPAVTVTGSGDYTISDTTYGDITISGISAGGVGLTGKEVTLAFDGTWEWDEDDITGYVAASVAQGAIVYITSGLVLTNSASGNTRYGTVDFPKDYDKTRGYIPIKVGA